MFYQMKKNKRHTCDDKKQHVIKTTCMRFTTKIKPTHTETGNQNPDTYYIKNISIKKNTEILQKYKK